MTTWDIRTAAVIVAAGRGTRAGGERPKQYRDLGGQPILARTLRAFLTHPDIDTVIAVIGAEDDADYRAIGLVHPALLAPVTGGASRAESVLAGLNALTQASPQVVLVHDAARPLVSPQVLSRVIDAAYATGGTVPTLLAVDSMRRSEGEHLGETVPRDGVLRAQTPQGFAFQDLLATMRSAQQTGKIASLGDEAEAMIEAGFPVTHVAGDPVNFKLTVPEDFAMAERLVAGPDIRMGQGFDVHAFGHGDSVTLCGVKIAHDRGLTGHSDADVGLHTITDALLGAVAEGDIGRHFPPSDDTFKGMDSAVFLRRAIEIVCEKGYAISNIDVTLICEEPKIGPHADAMIDRVADLCGLAPDRVSVKATTTERLGFCGRKEGIAAQAVATVIGRPV